MHQFKRFLFWKEQLVTQPAVTLGANLQPLSPPSPSSSLPDPAAANQHSARNARSIQRALAKSRKREAHKGIQALQITCGVSGVGFLVFGGADGRITVADHAFRLLSTRAYTKRVTHLSAVTQHGIIVSVGDGLDPRPFSEREMSSRISRLVRSRDDWSLERDAGSDDAKTAYARRDHSASIDDDPSPTAIMKIWRVVNTGGPREMSFPMECVHSFAVFSDALPEQMITSMSVMDNMSQIAIGLVNGAVMVIMPGPGLPTLMQPGQEPRRRILLPADPRGYRVTNLDYSYDHTLIGDDLGLSTAARSGFRETSSSSSSSPPSTAAAPFARRPSVDRSRAQMHKQQSQNISRMTFQHLSNVTLFVTTGIGRNRRGASSMSGRSVVVENQNGKPFLAPSSSSTVGIKGNNNNNSNDNTTLSAVPDDGGQLVSFANVEMASNEERPVPGMLLHEQGCNEGCCVVNGDGYAAMARTQGLFLYSAEDPGPCYWVDSPKTYLHWHGNYVVMVTDQSVVQRLSIYDVRNKITAFTKNFRIVDVSGKRAKAAKSALADGSGLGAGNSSTSASVMRMQSNASTMTKATEDAMLLRSDGEVRFVLEEWGKLFVVTSTHRVYALSEKDTRTKIEELERKHLYHIALSLAVNDMEHDVDSIFEICKNYGDHLYEKGEYDEAVQQYIHCGLHVEPSHVIRKFLEANRLNNLTEYLEALHRRNMQATTDHTTLLLTCYTQQQNVTRLRAFIGYQAEGDEKNGDSDQGNGNINPNNNGSQDPVSEIEHNFDVPTAIRVLHRRHFADEASFLARKHKKHDDFIRIQLENINAQRARAALVYISGLSFLDAEAALKVNGKTLLQYLPEETTEILKSICTPSAHNSTAQMKSGIAVKGKPNGSGMPMSNYSSSARISKGSSRSENSSSGPTGQSHATETNVMLVSDPEEFIATFVDHPLHLKRFLWHIVGSRRSSVGRVQTHGAARTAAAAAFKTTEECALVGASTLVWNTLLELCLNRDLAMRELHYQRQLEVEAEKQRHDQEDGKQVLVQQEPAKAQISDPLLSEILDMARDSAFTGARGNVVGAGDGGDMHTTVNLDAAANALVEDEVMALLKDSAARYDADHALVLVQQYHFEPGMMYLYEKRKMYHMLVQRHMDSGNHHAILATCRKYGQRDPNLWVQVLTYLADSYGGGSGGKSGSLGATGNVLGSSRRSGGVGSTLSVARTTGSNPQMCARYIQQVLQLGSAFLPPLLVLSILSKNRAIPLSIVHEYLIKHMRSEQQAIQDDSTDILESTSQIASIRSQMNVLETSAKVFQHSTDQLIPDQPLDLPVIHFMSGNSYNLENVEVTQDSHDGSGHFRHLDPNMAKQEHLLTQMHTDLRHKSQKHEDFYREMQAAGRGEGVVGGFDKVAEYFGLGVFDHPPAKKKSHGGTPSRLSRHASRLNSSPQTSNFDALLQSSGSQRGGLGGGPRSYRYDSHESSDAFGDVEDERERYKVLGAIKSKVASHYAR